jgi:anaerobic ribonucleoside-triphosphate reductase activating protein
MIKISGVVRESIVDGDGLRFVLFVQGCPHHCRGCHNPQTWNLSSGRWVSESDIIHQISDNPLLDGVTFSGGEPFFLKENEQGLVEIAKQVHKMGKTVWCYTGYLYEEIKDRELTKYVDVLVDGPFVEKLKCYSGFRGSTNQRIIKLDNVVKV